jgi:hypothetical protein
VRVVVEGAVGAEQLDHIAGQLGGDLVVDGGDVVEPRREHDAVAKVLAPLVHGGGLHGVFAACGQRRERALFEPRVDTIDESGAIAAADQRRVEDDAAGVVHGVAVGVAHCGAEFVRTLAEREQEVVPPHELRTACRGGRRAETTLDALVLGQCEHREVPPEVRLQVRRVDRHGAASRDGQQLAPVAGEEQELAAKGHVRAHELAQLGVDHLEHLPRHHGGLVPQEQCGLAQEIGERAVVRKVERRLRLQCDGHA